MKKIKKCMALFTVGIFCLAQICYPYNKEIKAEEKEYTISENSSLVQNGLVERKKKMSLEEYSEMKNFEKIEKSYREKVLQYETKGYILDMSLEEYAQNYSNKAFDFSKFLIKKTDNENSNQQIAMYISSGGGSTYYYNTGTSRPSSCNYSKYYLLSRIKQGDIFYEATGGKGITGHVGIVEGKFYTSKGYYIRVIEATPAYGVKRGVLDDTRVDERAISVWRVNTKDAIRKEAVNFAISQLNKGYDLDVRRKGHAANQKEWYCSELVWAAYYVNGLNIETSPGEPGVTPRDITSYSSSTYSINVTSYSTK